MNSTKYDLLIQESVGKEHLLDSFCYYDSVYFEELKNELKRHNCLNSFTTRELQAASKMKDERIKMCSVASSSRLGFLYGVQTNVCNSEKSNVRNTICKPNYDNYDEKTNTFFEYKCHEFTSVNCHNHFPRNPDGYRTLLKHHFNVDYDIKKQDIYSDFDIKPFLNFDFKQLICHLLGLLSIATKAIPVRLQYIMFIPNQIVLEKEVSAKEWLDNLEYQIKLIFQQMGKKQTVTCSGENGKLEDFIKLDFDYVSVSDVHDFIYEHICK